MPEATVYDDLTGAYSRNSAELLLANEINQGKRYGKPLSAILFAVDEFKSLESNRNHQQVEAVLKVLAETAGGNLRQADIFARWSGGEFLILTPGTDLQGARRLAERMSLVLDERTICRKIPITIRFGVVQHQPRESISQLFTRADQALNQAGTQGHGKIECLPEIP